jgi:hypothetical protein
MIDAHMQVTVMVFMVNLSASRIWFSTSNDHPSETTIVRLRQPRVDYFVTAFVPLPAIGWLAKP